MADHRSWDDFDVFIEGDHNITMATEGHPSAEDGIAQARGQNVLDPAYVEIGLSTAPNVRWWKGIRAYNRHGHDIGLIAMQDDEHASRWMRVRFDALSGGRLELEKAKALGVHTGMYLLLFDEMPLGGGSRFTFHWHRDS